jgi:hypothetical protein
LRRRVHGWPFTGPPFSPPFRARTRATADRARPS